MEGALAEVVGVEQDVEEEVIAVTGAEVLVLHPALLVAETVSEADAVGQFVRQQGFLVYTAFGDGGVAVAEGPGGNVGVAEGQQGIGFFDLVGKAAPDQQLLEIAGHVPVAVLDVALHAPGPLAEGAVEEIHVPGAELIFVEGGLGGEG